MSIVCLTSLQRMKVSECVPAAVVVLSGAVASFSITAIASFVLLYCQSRGLSSQWGGIFYCFKIKYCKYKVHYFCIHFLKPFLKGNILRSGE